ncbi:neurogenic locus notch homolog protein 1-like isoform X2 [Pollicipes pollicipes]|uniref:neurogenic locus notch homolog protein 1-like isoform X2 n=1 Tax=Pollicipes pollicipes TaxID=41117 RepID=UPI001884B324|nr:neurogenic locus notch homolog protein 1-like isoform X2 [Pollicipes pollicipes]
MASVYFFMVAMGLVTCASGMGAHGATSGKHATSPIARPPYNVADPCGSSPCGPNTECSIDNRGIGVCQCLPGYFPKPNTVIGCGPQCVSDNECGSGFICQGQKCVQRTPSYSGATGASSHRGSSGSGSNRNTASVSADPCSLGLCGTNANCNNVNGRAVCSCPDGYEGNPLTACTRGECSQDSECPPGLACVGVSCVDPCSRNVCGSAADCQVVNHRAICSCPVGYVGDPFVSCRYRSAGADQTAGGGGVARTGGHSTGSRVVVDRGTRYQDACSPSPCGTNTNCKVRGGRAICSCIANYIGDPLTGCRAECVSDAECASRQACVQNRCRNACTGACGTGAQCDAVNHRAICKCPKYYRGDGLTGCYPECTSHSECSASQACIQLRCGDPCAGACGVGANCQPRNHVAVCSCPPGFLGHPYDRCTPPSSSLAAGSSAGALAHGHSGSGSMCSPNPCGAYADCAPGTDKTGKPRPVCTCPRGYLGDPLTACQRGECEDHSNCPANQACYNYICTNPCLSASGGNVCGINALCRAQAHKGVCYCPAEYSGDPLTECRLKPVARGGHRTKRFIDFLIKTPAH